jgi:hypothetical protein
MGCDRQAVISAVGGTVAERSITCGEGGMHRCPSCLNPARIGPGASARRPLQGCYSRGLTRVFLASSVMATSFLCSPAAVEIRQLVVHTYPGGSKAAGSERDTVFYGRRGKPVKKPRFLPAELAHQLARKLQAKRLGTVSVL